MAEEWTINRVVYSPKVAAELLNTAEARIRDLLEANNRFEQDGRNWRIVEQLRAAEGSSVIIVNDNPDFEGPGALVECVGEWTGWEPEQFTGDTIAAALGAALVAFNQRRNGNAGN